MAMTYDMVIIGGGPAGLTAGLYASRARMKTVLVERALPGGQVLIADLIENFPGFPAGVTGPELADHFLKQAQHFGLEVVTADVRRLVPPEAVGGAFTIEHGTGAIMARSVIVATGAVWNTLGVPGEGEFAGRGVSYCATCDGPLFRNKEIVVVGGGDTALGDALFLAKFAAKVTVVHRRDKLRATKILQERAFANPKIAFCLESVPVAVCGQKMVEALTVRQVKTGAEQKIPAHGVFVLIGMSPNSAVVKGLVACDEKGYILTDDAMKTSVAGIFACGDVRQKTFRQIVTATGDGATAAASAEAYLESLKTV